MSLKGMELANAGKGRYDMGLNQKTWMSVAEAKFVIQVSSISFVHKVRLKKVEL